MDGARVFHSMNISSMLAESLFDPSRWFEPAFSWLVMWLVVVPVSIALGWMISYLYKAQRSIASSRIVGWLTFIRIVLVILVVALFFRPRLKWHHVEQSSETLWVLLD